MPEPPLRSARRRRRGGGAEGLQPAELDLALAALAELESRDQALGRQWQMRIERAEYEAALAERRYLEVDPSQRLVASTLERRWNDALLQFEDLKKQAAEFQRQEARVATPEQKAKVLALAKDLPRVWHAPTTQAKDRKRMLRLLLKDITVEKPSPQAALASPPLAGWGLDPSHGATPAPHSRSRAISGRPGRQSPGAGTALARCRDRGQPLVKGMPAPKVNRTQGHCAVDPLALSDSSRDLQRPEELTVNRWPSTLESTSTSSTIGLSMRF